MSDRDSPDLCVIGAGSAGLSVAAGASQMGARVVLIEADRMGGDCLNVGCVPSKAIIAAGDAAAAIRSAGRFGVSAAEPAIDFGAVHDHIHGVIGAIAPHDSVERFEGLGVDVISARAAFADPRTVEAGGRAIRAGRFVLATGSRPLIPPIPGLEAVPFLTNETVFGLREAPRHLLVLGGGPIGAELAQAFRRLGSEVTILEQARLMPREDPELVEVVRAALTADGITLREGVKVTGVETSATGIAALGGDGNRIEGSHLLVAVGRKPTVSGLGLDQAGIETGPRGVVVDARLRTTNRRVYAAGDVTGALPFTHIAGYHASVILKNALFHLPSKVDYRAAPHATYTDPELAQVGLTEAEAREREGDRIKVLRWNFHENDRAQAERDTHGMVKAVVDRRGRILGAGVVGRGAGDLLQPWVLAMHAKLRIGTLATMIAPYPTRGEATKRAAGSYYTESLFSDRTRWLVRLLARIF